MANHSYAAIAAVETAQGDPLVAAVRDGRHPDAGKKKQWRKGGHGNKTAGGKQEPWHVLGICKRHYDFGKECYKCVDPSTCKWVAGN
jgi:hypothetical protein